MIFGPLGDGRVAPRAAHDGPAGQRHDSHQRVLTARAAAGVGDHAEEVEQASVRGHVPVKVLILVSF